MVPARTSMVRRLLHAWLRHATARADKAVTNSVNCSKNARAGTNIAPPGGGAAANLVELVVNCTPFCGVRPPLAQWSKNAARVRQLNLPKNINAQPPLRGAVACTLYM